MRLCKTGYPGVYFRFVRQKGDSEKKEKMYVISFWYGGKKFEQSVGRQKRDNMTPAKANNIRSDILNKKQRPAFILKAEKKNASSFSVEKMANYYWNNCTNDDGISVKNRSTYKADLSRLKTYLVPFFKTDDMRKKNSKDIEKLYIFVKRQGKKPQTVKHVMGLLRRILIFNDIFIEKYKMPKVDNQITEDLTVAERDRLLKVLQEDKINPQVALMLLFIMGTGCRQGEVRKLQWRDIDFTRKTITLRKTKSGNNHSIPMSDNIRKLLTKQIQFTQQLKTSSEFVFPSQSGKMKSSISKPARRLLNRAGIPKSFRPCHGLRHWFATELYDQKQDLYLVSRMLNHSEVKMSERYSKIRSQRKQDAAETMGQLLEINNG